MGRLEDRVLEARASVWWAWAANPALTAAQCRHLVGDFNEPTMEQVEEALGVDAAEAWVRCQVAREQYWAAVAQRLTER